MDRDDYILVQPNRLIRKRYVKEIQRTVAYPKANIFRKGKEVPAILLVITGATEEGACKEEEIAITRDTNESLFVRLSSLFE